MERFDFLVIGAGIAGLSAAIRLADAGTVLLSYRRDAETHSVLPDGPPARSAATSWRVYRFGQDGFLWPSRWSGMIVLIGHHSALIALVASMYGTV